MLTLFATSALAFQARNAVLTKQSSMRTSSASMLGGVIGDFVDTRAALSVALGTSIEIPKYAALPAGGMAGVLTTEEKAADKATTVEPITDVLAPVTQAEVVAAQKLWADSIASISKVYLDGDDFVGAAGEAAGKLYGYGHCDVLFKPTKATAHPFRPTGGDAMSYFVGAEAMQNDDFKGEDAGFAINGGRGWKSVVFRNHQIQSYGEIALAMGDYVFTDATSGDEVRVEYTFGYKRCDDGQVRICLHHSSVPYTAAPAAVTTKEVEAAQQLRGTDA